MVKKAVGKLSAETARIGLRGGRGNRADQHHRRPCLPVITSERLRRLQRVLGDLSADHPVIAAYTQLQRARSAYVAGQLGIDDLAAVAATTARTLAEFEPLWNVVGELSREWDYNDSQLADQLLERDADGVVDAERELLTAAGVRPEIAELIIEVAAFRSPRGSTERRLIVDPHEAQASLRNTAEDLENAQREAEIRDIREEADQRSRDRLLRFKLKRIGRVIQVGAGGVLVLVDCGATAAAAIANPLAGVGAGALAVVSLGKGTDLIKSGISPAFGDD